MKLTRQGTCRYCGVTTSFVVDDMTPPELNCSGCGAGLEKVTSPNAYSAGATRRKPKTHRQKVQASRISGLEDIALAATAGALGKRLLKKARHVIDDILD